LHDNYKSKSMSINVFPTIKRNFLYFALSALLIAFQFLFYLLNSPQLELMDLPGWLFFIASCISHASMFAIIPFLIALPFAFLKNDKVSAWIQIILVALLSIINYLNYQVFGLYHFHINGFVLNMVFGPNAGEIFTFDKVLYLKEGLYFFIIAGISVALYLVALYIFKRWHKAFAWCIGGVIVFATLYAHIYHIYGSFIQKTSVTESARVLPYYFPTTAYGLLLDHGFVRPDNCYNIKSNDNSGDIQYPLNPLKITKKSKLPNIVIILVDSWSRRSFTPECMPNCYRLAMDNQWYLNHLSCSNGTRSAVFGLITGLSAYYFESFEANHTQPLLITQMLKEGYECQVYPSAPLLDPPFARVLFSRISHLNVETKGETAFSRDHQLTTNFINDLNKRKDDETPFFSFLFYDQPHAIQQPPVKNNKFKPVWDYTDYTKLNNGLDPTPFFNIYRNCCYDVDQQIGKVIKVLKDKGVYDNTIIVLTGDHAQEFNENKKKYWGHNGNFSVYQIGVPMVCKFPGMKPRKYTYRTTHYDIVPTLMHDYLGVSNPVSDYSFGHLLSDKVSRNWHVVGSSLNYAFIVDNDTIIEKTAEGSLRVNDWKMNLVTNYHLNTNNFNAAVDKLNRFYKKK
jgi:uncharacterized protein